LVRSLFIPVGRLAEEDSPKNILDMINLGGEIAELCNSKPDNHDVLAL